MIYSRRTRFVLGLAGGFAAGVIFAFAVSELNSGTYSSAVSSGNSGSSAEDSGQAADGQSDARLSQQRKKFFSNCVKDGSEDPGSFHAGRLF